ncbi:hypothetical protein WOLCODRAFT_144912 [Wolfiporia cocos MD-104 SS10]|uniref:Uncharacterized protein n=1 Tax=Wolfiporia cocos (strain MD-104) TaxID=742152 RepID=A0A2H3JWD9_WOLCO|nr:hypothetical protein WOLCODRAFT_144912 [Wolfiporia cocos MD-104 SS10]
MSSTGLRQDLLRTVRPVPLAPSRKAAIASTVKVVVPERTLRQSRDLSRKSAAIAGTEKPTDRSRVAISRADVQPRKVQPRSEKPPAIATQHVRPGTAGVNASKLEGTVSRAVKKSVDRSVPSFARPTTASSARAGVHVHPPARRGRSSMGSPTVGVASPKSTHASSRVFSAFGRCIPVAQKSSNIAAQGVKGGDKENVRARKVATDTARASRIPVLVAARPKRRTLGDVSTNVPESIVKPAAIKKAICIEVAIHQSELNCGSVECQGEPATVAGTEDIQVLSRLFMTPCESDAEDEDDGDNADDIDNPALFKLGADGFVESAEGRDFPTLVDVVAVRNLAENVVKTIAVSFISGEPARISRLAPLKVKNAVQHDVQIPKAGRNGTQDKDIRKAGRENSEDKFTALSGVHAELSAQGKHVIVQKKRNTSLKGVMVDSVVSSDDVVNNECSTKQVEGRSSINAEFDENVASGKSEVTGCVGEGVLDQDVLAGGVHASEKVDDAGLAVCIIPNGAISEHTSEAIPIEEVVTGSEGMKTETARNDGENDREKTDVPSDNGKNDGRTSETKKDKSYVVRADEDEETKISVDELWEETMGAPVNPYEFDVPLPNFLHKTINAEGSCWSPVFDVSIEVSDSQFALSNWDNGEEYLPPESASEEALSAMLATPVFLGHFELAVPELLTPASANVLVHHPSSPKDALSPLCILWDDIFYAALHDQESTWVTEKTIRNSNSLTLSQVPKTDAGGSTGNNWVEHLAYPKKNH